MADLVILQAGQTPPAEATGQMWLQTNTGQLWAFLNNKWTPITGGRSFEILNPFSVFINGVNQTCNIKMNSLKINNQITSKVDTCSFTFLNDGDSDARPEVGNQIDIFEHATSTKIYSGEISKITQKQESLVNNYFTFSISSTDFTKRLAKRLIIKDYENEKAGDIIKDIIDNYYTEFSYINVVDGPTIDYLSFNYITGLEAIKKVAKVSGYDWYVDPTKDIHFFLSATNYAPYALYDGGSTVFSITENNKYIDTAKISFGTVYKTAIVEEGIYLTINSLLTAITTAMQNAGFSSEYKAELVGNKVKIYRDIPTGNIEFQLLFSSGVNADKSMASILGFEQQDYTGATEKEGYTALNDWEYSSDDELVEANHYYNLSIARDKTNYRNKIYLQGGYYTEAFSGDIQVADGTQTTFNLAYEPFSPVAVFIDTGSGYVEKTLGIDNIDTSGYDFVVNQSEKCVRNLDYATLNSGDKIKITYYKKVKIIVEDEDTTSQSDIQAREGGDGVYEYKLNDETVTSLNSANERITAEISDYKDPQITGSFNTDQTGYEAGQILKTYLGLWGYDYDGNEFKIQTVTTTPKTAVGEDARAYIDYKITFRSFERSFEQFLLNMYNNSVNQEIVVKGDEKLIT